jgi:nucleoside-diphosphate-sugar epimerase
VAVLIIGAGLVGSQIARILVAQGERPVLMDVAAQRNALGEIVDLARVTLVEGNILRPLRLTEVIQENRITDVVHTVANPMLTLGAQRDPYAAIELNIMGTVNVLEAARVHKLNRVVVSSSNVLNHFITAGSSTGDHTREDAFARPLTFYASTKQAIENIGLNYAQWCGVDFVAVRYGAVAGPWSGAGGGGPSNILRQAVLNALKGEESVIPSGGLEWVYSKDAGRGTVLALQAKSPNQRIFNITMGKLVSADELAAALKQVILGTRVRIQTPEGASAAIPPAEMLRASDQTAAKGVLGFTPEYGIVEAVKDLAGWLKTRGGS